jgi:tRNA-splicing ligase RtcB
MLHSGSRNIGNVIAKYHIEKAKKLAEKYNRNLPDKDLAWLAIEDGDDFNAYVHDLDWAQEYAKLNRLAMQEIVWGVLKKEFPNIQMLGEAINCHHNYVEFDYGGTKDLFLTRKGAVDASEGKLGLIPGSMGTRSYVVRGLGNEESYNSCSHGAGRKFSRSAARKHFTVKDLEEQTQGVECRKDQGVLDELPQAYKNIDEVMANQKDLVETVAELKQVLCIKG